MNALIWIIGGYGLLALSHFVLKKPTERIMSPDPNLKTPAMLSADSRDYAKNHAVIVAGQYFMAIAGLSPILSAIMGLYWGWLPALLWMLIGVAFLGTPTEYINIMASVRNKGATMGEIVRKVIGNASGIYAALSLWFIGTITYAIFMNTMAKTMVTVPMAAIPTISLTLIAMLFGYTRNKFNIPILSGTITALILWGITIYMGICYPLSITYNQWVVGLIIYTLVAAYLPVWLILAPRDFLNSGVLIFGVLIVTIALLVGIPSFKFPSFVGWETARGLLWPAIMATITCGAINAAHCMISAGIVSRQLDNEKHAYSVVSFGTKGETILALATIALVATQVDYTTFTTMVVKNPGGTFSQAFATAGNGYLGIPLQTGLTMGALTLTGFIITTMDAYARSARYCLEELARQIRPLGALRLEKPICSTFFVVLIGTWLALKTPFSQLWAGFALCSLTFAIYPYSVVLINRLEEKKPFNGHFYKWIIIPGSFMWVSSLGALLFFMSKFYRTNEWIALVMSIAIFILFALSTIQIYTRIKNVRKDIDNQLNFAQGGVN